MFPLIFEDPRTNINIIDIEGRSILSPYYSDYELFAQLIKRKDININVITNDGYTPLHYAVSYNDMDIFLFLLSSGLNIPWTHLTKDGTSFLHIAASVKSKQFINYFVKKGLNFNMQDNYGKTPLMVLIVQSGDIIKIWNSVLNRKDLKINLKDKEGIWFNFLTKSNHSLCCYKQKNTYFALTFCKKRY